MARALRFFHRLCALECSDGRRKTRGGGGGDDGNGIHSKSEEDPWGWRLVLSGLGLILAALGLFFTFLLWDSYQRGRETRQWKETPCEVITSQVKTDKPTPNSPPEYTAFVQYRYELDKAIFHGSKIRRDSGPSTDREKADGLCAKYKVGLKTVCYVNPMDPGNAVLEHTSLAAVYSIWFPLLFVAGGFGMIFSAWRRPRAAVTKHQPERIKCQTSGEAKEASRSR